MDGGAPDIAVYGDESKDMFPYLPDYAGVTLVEAQKLLRTYITMVWSKRALFPLISYD